MKTRKIIIFGIVTLIGVVAWLLLAMSKMTAIPSDRFSETLQRLPEITIISHTTKSPDPLPLALRMRFPKQPARASTGYMSDRSDVLILKWYSKDIECVAHVRDGSVCYVTLTGDSEADAMRYRIQKLFPLLSVN